MSNIDKTCMSVSNSSMAHMPLKKANILSKSSFSTGLGFVFKALIGKKHISVIAVSTLGSMLMASSAMAQSSLPTFTCEADAFNVFGAPTQLQKFNPSTQTVLSSIGISPAIEANAIGYNPLDNYIYGMVVGDRGISGFANRQFVRIGENGVVENLGFPQAATTGLPVFNANLFAGVMDAAGNWYGLDNNNIYIVNIGNVPANGMLTYTVRPRSGFTGNATDIAFSPFDGNLYASGGGQLRRINPNTGFGDLVPISGDALASAGGAWSTSNGDLYFYSNSNANPAVTRVDLSQSPAEVTIVGSVPGNARFDSTACLPPQITKIAITSPDSSGAFDYEFTLSNAFVNPISVNFSDPLPAELRFLPGTISPANPGGGSITNFTDNNLDITNLTLPATSSLTFRTSVELRPNIVAGTSIINQATLSFGGAVIPSDNPASPTLGDGTIITVPIIPNLILEKPEPINTDEDGSGTVTLGDTLTYTITATNDGNGPLNNVTVSDPMLAAPNDTTTCATLAIGATCVLIGTHVVTVTDVNAGMIDNTANVTSDEVTAAVEASQSTPALNQTADLSITKTNTPGVNGEADQANDSVTSGQMTTYTLVITNNGPDSVTGAVVTDTPSGDLTCADINPVAITGDGVPAGTFTIADLTGAGISLENLDDGQSATLTYSCEVN